MKKISKVVLAVIFSMTITNINAEEMPKIEKKEIIVDKKENSVPAPKTEKVMFKKVYQNVQYIDEYNWLRDKKNPKVIEHLKEENNYTEKIMEPSKNTQDKLYKEMLGIIKEDDASVPEKNGDYYYYSKTQKGKQYPLHYRKFKSLTAKEEIILDENKLAGKSKYFSLAEYEVSKDGRYLAYAIDLDGSETYTINIIDLKTGLLLKDQIKGTSGSIEWSNNNKFIFYTTVDSAKRPFKLFRHEMTKDTKKDVLIHHEKDDSFYLSISKSKTNKYIFINLGSQVTSEVRYLDADKVTDPPKIFAPRQKNIEYSIEHSGDKFVIMTNEDSPNNKIMVTPVIDTKKASWFEIVPHWPGLKIDTFDVFKDFLVLQERENAYKKILIVDMKTYASKYLKFDEPAYDVNIDSVPEYNTLGLRFRYESLTTPNTLFEYDLKSGARKTLKVRSVLGDYDPKNYVSERVYVKSKDDAIVPVSLVYKKGLVKDGTAPLMLYAYGSYGSTEDPNFSSSRISLLDRGFVYAIAHIRGGGDMGREWYDNGKLLKKKNTFEDFINCAEFLIKEKYTSKEKLAISGGSAGGLLMGAVTNMRPDLFKSVVAHVPFVDVINTMMDPSLPLTVIEYDEWGNPNKPEFFDYMKSYSPYDNVTAKEYPNMLVTAGLNDPRVGYWEPAK